MRSTPDGLQPPMSTPSSASLSIGRKPGRTNPEEITVFDSTGVAIQDTASAAWIYQRALASNVGTFIPLGSP
jgi:ornithine cyclodeaminase/alanine dehydrogenase-like protein (mu-crystallin family)